MPPNPPASVVPECFCFIVLVAGTPSNFRRRQQEAGGRSDVGSLREAGPARARRRSPAATRLPARPRRPRRPHGRPSRPRDQRLPRPRTLARPHAQTEARGQGQLRQEAAGARQSDDAAAARHGSQSNSRCVGSCISSGYIVSLICVFSFPFLFRQANPRRRTRRTCRQSPLSPPRVARKRERPATARVTPTCRRCGPRWPCSRTWWTGPPSAPRGPSSPSFSVRPLYM